MSFLLLPIITRYLSPEAYGDYALALTISNFVGVLGSSWMRNLAMRLHFDARESGNSRGFFWTVATCQVIAVTLAFGVLAAVVGTVWPVQSMSVIVVAGLSLLAGDFFTLSVNTLRGEQLSLSFAVSQLMSAGLRLAGTVMALLLGFHSSVGLLAASGIAVLIPGVYAAFQLNRSLSGPLMFDPKGFLQLMRLGPVSIPFSLGVWVTALSDRLVLDHFASKETVGIYSAGYSLADKLIGSLVSAVFMMAWPTIMKEWSENGDQKVVATMRSAMQTYLWLTVGPLVFLLVYPRTIVGWLAAPAYAEASATLPLIALGSWIRGFSSYLNRPLELRKRYRVMSAVTMATAILNLILTIVLVPRLDGMGAAIATLTAYLFAGGAYWVVTERNLIRIPFRDLLGSLTLCAFAWGLARLFNERTVVSVAVFVAVYALGFIAVFARRVFGRSLTAG